MIWTVPSIYSHMPWKQFNLYKGKNNSCHWLIFSSEFIVLLESLKTNPSFYYNSLFHTARRCYFGRFKKTSRVRRTRQGGKWISNLVKQFTFTISFDDLAILFRVNLVFPVSHLVPFTRFNLTTGFRRKFFDGSEGNYVRKNRFHARIYTIMQFDTSWCDGRGKNFLPFLPA